MQKKISLSQFEESVFSVIYPYLMKGVRLFNPEFGHNLALVSLRLGLCGGKNPWQDDPSLSLQAMGLKFPNPVGIAAGFDKNALAVTALARLGFGSIEVGTVTPKPQPGNPKPRLFRLMKDGAVINRMGFNNNGIQRLCAQLAKISNVGNGVKTQANVPVGVNIGINKIGACPERDYPLQIGLVSRYADYIVLNFSSPNTPGLRDLQQPQRMEIILQSIQQLQPNHPPLLVKLSPDLLDAELEAIVEVVMNNHVTGLILTNTTVSRPDNLQSDFRYEPGGLSGRPLRQKSTEMLAKVAKLSQGKLTLIGSGGIENGADVLEKIMHGADFTQLYTAFAYEGPPVISRIKRELVTLLKQYQVRTISELKGVALS